MREYVYGPGGIPLLDAPIHGSTGGAPAMYLHTDSAGSVRFATNAAGDEVWARSFDAYGADAGTWTAAGYAGPMSRIGWQGHYRDDPGMLYVKTRVYDPAAGGFISEDPAVDMTGEAYGYANSNPIAFTDETGTMPSLQDFQAGFGAANERIYSVAGPALAFYQKSSFEASMGVMDSLTFGGFTGWFDIDVNKCSWFYNGGKIGTDVALMLIPGGGAAVGVAKIGLRGAKIANAVSKAGRAGRAISAVGREARTAARVCRNSFTGDTPVRMADGSSKPIRDVKIGDTVLATDPETGETAAEPVTNLIRHAGEHAMVAVTLADGTTINSTAEHPFWETRDQEFTDAEDLKAGDTVLAANGSTVAVARLTPSQADLTAYNLEVADIHTYYAGGATVLTHNACGPKGIHSRLNSGDRGIDIPHVWTNGRLYTQIRDDEVRLVRVLEKGNGKYDVVIREADGSPVTAFRITAKQLADRLKSGRWQ
jgi:RHS repeat-associated protein